MAFDYLQLKNLLREFEHSPLQLSLHIFENLPSTNQTLWDLLEQGAAPGTIAIALEQTAGKGQWGRQWSSPKGGLYLSLALAPDLPGDQSHHLTICSAWGIATQLRSYEVPVLLKWPNDLFLNGRKLGGILTETKVQDGKITKAVIGVGINWTNPVPEIGINLESFYQNQPNPLINSLETLAAIAITGILSGYQHYWDFGIESIIPAYKKLLIKDVDISSQT